MIIEAIKEYFTDCPLLKDGAICVDYLPEGISYSLNPTGTNTWYKKYVDGGGIRRYEFVFSSNEYFSEDEQTNISNSAFYEELGRWIENNNMSGTLPKLEGYTADSVEIITSGFLMEPGDGYGQYQIVLRLLYY